MGKLIVLDGPQRVVRPADHYSVTSTSGRALPFVLPMMNIDARDERCSLGISPGDDKAQNFFVPVLGPSTLPSG